MGILIFQQVWDRLNHNRCIIAFFEIGADKTLFDGLKISQETKLCEEYMGRFPVISITLKSVDGLNYQAACAALRYIIGMEAMRFQFLLDSDMLSNKELLKKDVRKRWLRLKPESMLPILNDKK